MAGTVASLITPDTRIKVSSTLDKSAAKKHLVDGSPETCWTSQEGLPQYIQLRFPAPVAPRRVSLTFQGGFVGTRCSVETAVPGRPGWAPLTKIYPEDVNRRQTFEFEETELGMQGTGVDALQLVFEESSDFFGRITVYDLQVYGTVVG